MIHATGFPRRSPERLRPVSARQSGTLRCRACYRLSHNARVSPWPPLGVQIGLIDAGERLDHISRPRLKGGFWLGQTDVSSHLAPLTTPFRTVHGPPSAPQHTPREGSPSGCP